MIGVQQVPTGLQVEEAVAIVIIDKIPEKMRVGVVQRRLLLLLTTKDEQTSRNVPADTQQPRSNHNQTPTKEIQIPSAHVASHCSVCISTAAHRHIESPLNPKTVCVCVCACVPVAQQASRGPPPPLHRHRCCRVPRSPSP